MPDERVSTGISGLDEVLHGGLIRRNTYLISGPPGTGKTTFGWHFLTSGVAAGEPVLFVTFGQPERTLRANATAFGFDLSGIEFVDLSPSAEHFVRIENYDIFSPAEVEREPVMQRIVAAVERIKPRRVFIDSMTHIRYLAPDSSHFRRQALSFLRYFVEQHGADVIATSEMSPEAPDDDLRFVSDGVIELARGAGPHGISLTVIKFRGSDFSGGSHTVRLGERGATVFPQLIPSRHSRPFSAETLSSGVSQLDGMLHGGIERGSVTLISGPSGVGKTTLGVQFMKAAAERGERSAIYTFEEPAASIVRRTQNLNISAAEMLERKTLVITEIEPLRFGPDEFANLVRRDVEDNGTQLVMVDSTSGYRLSIAGEDPARRLHALSKYLQNVGVTVLLMDELPDPFEFRVSNIGISYLIDTVIILRYIERRDGEHAELHRALGILKKRASDTEHTLRELTFGRAGLEIGKPLPFYLGGILTQVPRLDVARGS